MQQLITDFFEDQFQNTSHFFLYKDKQLLKNGRYREYANEQIRKADNIFWTMTFGIVMCAGYGTFSLIEYGASPNWFDLIIGLGGLLGVALALFYSAKEYYTIKSSMSLLLKLLDSKGLEESESTE